MQTNSLETELLRVTKKLKIVLYPDKIIEDMLVDNLFRKDTETAEEAKSRLKNS